MTDDLAANIALINTMLLFLLEEMFVGWKHAYLDAVLGIWEMQDLIILYVRLDAYT